MYCYHCCSGSISILCINHRIIGILSVFAQNFRTNLTKTSGNCVAVQFFLLRFPLCNILLKNSIVIRIIWSNFFAFSFSLRQAMALLTSSHISNPADLVLRLSSKKLRIRLYSDLFGLFRSSISLTDLQVAFASSLYTNKDYLFLIPEYTGCWL